WPRRRPAPARQAPPRPPTPPDARRRRCPASHRQAVPPRYPRLRAAGSDRALKDLPSASWLHSAARPFARMTHLGRRPGPRSRSLSSATTPLDSGRTVVLMPNPSEPDRGGAPKRPGFDPRGSRSEPSEEWGPESGPETGSETDATESVPLVPSDAETETVVINKPGPGSGPEESPGLPQRERRFTAPGFDAKETTIISTTPEPATEAFAVPPGSDGTAQFGVGPKAAVPQSIPPRLGGKLRTSTQFN